MTGGSVFGNQAYYRFQNNVNSNLTMSSGLASAAPALTEASMTTLGSLSSENWQIFYSSGVYFIRNYDDGAGLQLGLTTSSGVIPEFLNSTGDLGQQWDFTQRSDGTWRITNILTGNGTVLGLVDSQSTPAMNTDDDAGHWDVTINASAGTITDSAMLAAVSNVQTVSSSSAPATSTAAATSHAATSGSSVTGSAVSATASSSTTSAITSAHHSSSGLAPGAIAGIVIGVIAVGTIAGFAALILRRRRKASSRQQDFTPAPPSEMPADSGINKVIHEKQAPLVEEQRSELP